MNKEPTRKTKARRNVVFGYMNKLVLTFLEFFCRAVFIKTLGEDFLGINGVFTNVIQLMSLAELGLHNVVSYSFYKPLANSDEAKVASLIGFYRSIYNKIALIVLVLGLLLFPFIDRIINVDLDIAYIRTIFMLFVLDAAFSYLFVYKTILLTADQKGYISNAYTIILNTIRVVAQIIALIFFKNILVYLSIKVAATACYNILLSKRVDREYPCLGTKPAPVVAEEKKSLGALIKSGFIYKLSALLLNSTDNILISVLTGTVWVGYVANYDTVYSGLGAFYTILFSNLTPSVGNLVASDAAERAHAVFEYMSFASAWMAFVFTACFFLLSKEFITLWIGGKFVLETRTVLCIAIKIFLSCSMQPIFSYREALGLYKKTKYVMLLAAVLNIMLSVVLGHLLGLFGILFASLVAMVGTYVWYEPYLLYKVFFHKRFFPYLLKKLYDVFCFVAGIAFLSSIFNRWSAGNFRTWILKAMVVFCCANIMCLLAYGYTSAFRRATQHFFRRNA